VLTAGLFVIQPIARLWGRFAHGLTPWRARRHGNPGQAAFLPRASFTHTVWSETWHGVPEWLEMLRSRFCSLGALATAAGAWDGWDYEIRGGLFTGARVRLVLEEHGAGRQLLRWRVWPRIAPALSIAAAVLATLALGAAENRAWTTAGVLGACFVLGALEVTAECGRAMGLARAALENLSETRTELHRLESPQPASASLPEVLGVGE
jgi:hypothetical protein